MRVPQEAQVEDEVGLARQAAGVPKDITATERGGASAP
jgi:hypothetical protein